MTAGHFVLIDQGGGFETGARLDGRLTSHLFVDVAHVHDEKAGHWSHELHVGPAGGDGKLASRVRQQIPACGALRNRRNANGFEHSFLRAHEQRVVVVRVVAPADPGEAVVTVYASVVPAEVAHLESPQARFDFRWSSFRHPAGVEVCHEYAVLHQQLACLQEYLQEHWRNPSRGKAACRGRASRGIVRQADPTLPLREEGCQLLHRVEDESDFFVVGIAATRSRTDGANGHGVSPVRSVRIFPALSTLSVFLRLQEVEPDSQNDEQSSGREPDHSDRRRCVGPAAHEEAHPQEDDHHPAFASQ